MTANSSRTTFKLIVDADSCPVKDIILAVARDTSTPVLLVASVSHQMSCQGEGIRVLTVDKVPQAADIAVINNVLAGDIVVTGDYGLAALVLAKGAVPLSPRGNVYTDANIDGLLLRRHLEARIRRGGGRIKGPAVFGEQDRQRFGHVLRGLIARQRAEHRD